MSSQCSPLTLQKTIVLLLKFCFDQSIAFMQCTNHKCLVQWVFTYVYKYVVSSWSKLRTFPAPTKLPPSCLPTAVFLLKGNPDSGCCDIGQGHMGFKCNTSISINSKMYLLECARVQGSILGRFPEVACKKGSLSSQVTNPWAFQWEVHTLIILRVNYTEGGWFYVFLSSKGGHRLSQNQIPTQFPPLFTIIPPPSVIVAIKWMRFLCYIYEWYLKIIHGLSPTQKFLGVVRVSTT